jgi:hypothetical protein
VVRTIKIIGVLGFVICLLVMYMTNHGIRGIQNFDRDFRLLDMRFHYSSEIVKQTFEQISAGGRGAYQRYLILDFVFILFFLATMITVSDAIPVSLSVKIALFIVCGLRALLDILENILLLRMLGQYPVFNEAMASVCSRITTFKFIMLYLWLVFILMHIVISGVISIRREP